MAERKTQLTPASVADFLGAFPAERRDECQAIAALMEKATKSKARMWGTTIVGFGETMVEYAGGRTEPWMVMGFAPRKDKITLYGLGGAAADETLAASLGKVKWGGSCLHIKRLADVHLPTLAKLVQATAKAKTSTATR